MSGQDLRSRLFRFTSSIPIYYNDHNLDFGVGWVWGTVKSSEGECKEKIRLVDSPQSAYQSYNLGAWKKDITDLT